MTMRQVSVQIAREVLAESLPILGRLGRVVSITPVEASMGLPATWLVVLENDCWPQGPDCAASIRCMVGTSDDGTESSITLKLELPFA